MRTERKRQFATDSCPLEVPTREIPKVKEQQTKEYVRTASMWMLV